MSKDNGVFQFKQIDPNTIKWTRISKFQPIIERTNNLKIGEAFSVTCQDGFNSSVATIVRKASYFAVKGVYRIRIKLSNDWNTLNIVKTNK